MGRVLKDLLLGLGLACALQTPTRTVSNDRAPQTVIVDAEPGLEPLPELRDSSAEAETATEAWRNWQEHTWVRSTAAGRRSYVDEDDFFPEAPRAPAGASVDAAFAAATPALVTAAAYAAYPFVQGVLGGLPPPNSAEGGYFFSLMSIVYGTLTASTISDSTTRLSNLRAAAVEEVTSLPAVTRRLESMLLGRHATLEMGRVFEDVAAGVLAHTDALIGGSTAEELASISDSRDPLLDVVAVLEDAQHELGLDLGFALDGVERAIAARGKRLSLERSSIAPEQFAVLRGLAVALVGAYTYLTLDHNGGTPSLLGFTLDGGLDASIGVHVLFSLVVGAVSVFGNLAEDLNRPFTANKLESDTVVASLKQLRDGLLPHIRRG